MKRLILFDIISESIHLPARIVILNWTWPGFLIGPAFDLLMQVMRIVAPAGRA